MYPTYVKAILSAQHWVTSFLWQITGSLVAFRLIGISILILSSIILTFGATRAITSLLNYRLSNANKLIIYCCSLSGALLYGATINFSPCYNLLSASGSYIAFGLIMLSQSYNLKWINTTLYFLAGCAIGVVFLNKASTAFSVFSLLILLIIINKSTLKESIPLIILMVFGAFLFSGLVVLFNTNGSSLFEEIRFGLNLFKQVQAEGALARVFRYAKEFIFQHLWSGFFLIIPVFFVLRLKKLRNINILLICISFIVIALAYIHLIAYIYYSFDIKRHIWIITTSSLSSILVLSLISSIKLWYKDLKTSIIVLCLFLLPYAISFGSGNNINIQIVVSLSSWGILVSVFSFGKGVSEPRKIIGYLIGFSFIVTIVGQTLFSSFKPYHLNDSIWRNNISLNIGDIGKVKVDEHTLKFVTTLDSISQEYSIQKGQFYLGFYELPGVSIIIGGIPYLSPWITNIRQAEIIINKTDSIELDRMIIGISTDNEKRYPELPFQINGITDRFIMCGEAYWPFNEQYIQLWMKQN